MYEAAAREFASLLAQHLYEQDKDHLMTPDYFKVYYYPIKDNFRTWYFLPEEESAAEGDYMGELSFSDVRYALEENVDFRLVLKGSTFGHPNGLRHYVAEQAKRDAEITNEVRAAQEGESNREEQ